MHYSGQASPIRIEIWMAYLRLTADLGDQAHRQSGGVIYCVAVSRLSVALPDILTKT